MKINIPIHIFLILSFSFTVSAQDCLPKGITFSTQKQIDNFSTNYPDCTKIKGDVRIEERNPKSINNLNGLFQITSIEGNLKVSVNTDLTSLKGLNNLTSIGGQLGIWGNTSLENLSDLENLNTINGHLTISKNTSLINLSGLNNLTFIGGLLRIKENDSLTNLDGLNNLTSIEKDLWVGNNNNLKDLTGLENVTTIKANLLISLNKSLVNVDGLNNLTTIGGSMKIWENPSLTSLSGLDNVTSIKGNTNVYDNASLTNQKKLEKLSLVSEQKLESVSVKKNIKPNKKMKQPAYDDATWEFGAEVGFASMKLKKNMSSKNGFLGDSRKQTVKRSNRRGFRAMATAKYNINGQVHIIGGIGITHAEGTGNRDTNETDFGLFSSSVTTTTDETVSQKYTLIQIPLYFRWHLFGKHRPYSNDSNIFFDLGASFIAPFTDESYFEKSKKISNSSTKSLEFRTNLNSISVAAFF